MKTEQGQRPDQCSITFVTEKRDFKRFIDFPYKHYVSDEHWIAPLKIQQKEILDVNKHPFYKNAEIALFIAEFNGQTAGRIAAINNRVYNEFHGENAGFFGFFESIDNQQVANLLFKVAEDWLKDRGLKTIYGPVSPNMMGEMGALVEGFEHDPSMMMPYNKPYYDQLISNAGYSKHVDLLAFRIDDKKIDLERINKADEIVKRRLPDLVIRDVNMKDLKNEAKIIREIFNKAWAKNWGFTPLSIEEFDYLVKDLKLILDTDFANIAEINGQPVAFSISLPDLNVVLKKMNGTLFPTGIFKLLYHKNKIRSIRTALMGVLPEWQGRGIDTIMHQRAVGKGLKRGFYTSELSWLLETNTSMINVALRLGAWEEKRYRIYVKQ